MGSSTPIILMSRDGLATRLKNEVLTGKASGEEGNQIILAYLVRAGTITEFALPTPTE